MISDSPRLWEALVGVRARQRRFAAVALEALALILLLRRPTAPKWALLADVAALLATEGYRAEPDGAAPSADDIAWQLADPLRLLELFRMVATSGGWDDRRLALPPAGEATPWALLRARATVPLEWDGP